MSDSAPETPDPRPPDSAPAPDDGLAELQQLLFGREKKQISRLQERLDNPALHARDVGRILPRAIAQSGAQGGQLARALTPSVESALRESIKRDPGVMVGAIFPIIGPAVRKAIAETFSKMVQSLNHSLEHSFSVRGLQWRLEAARTGKSFAEVVLAHTLIYRVEQVFLIHRKTSLLLQHASAAHGEAPEGDVISAMLSAIQDFVKDSFHAAHSESVQTLQVGEWNVWVETGPQAMIAAVIRGQAPEEFRSTLQNALERIHAEQADALAVFDGDAAPFDAARGHLEDCLKVQFGGQAKRSLAKFVTALVILLIALSIWGFFAWRGQRRWNQYLATLRAQEGLVVTEATRSGGRYHVAGWRDPLAPDPRQFLAESRIDSNKVDFRWESYQSLNPELIARRAVLRLQPPPGVSLSFRDGVLYAEGTGPRVWADAARRAAESLPGVLAFDFSRLGDDTLAPLAARRAAVEQTLIVFDDGVRLAAGQDAALDALVLNIDELRRAAALASRRLRITVTGHTDTMGSEETNLRLSRQRAEQIISLLVAKGVPAEMLAPVGVSFHEPRRDGPIGPDSTLNRRVSFRVTLEEAPPGAATP